MPATKVHSEKSTSDNKNIVASASVSKITDETVIKGKSVAAENAHADKTNKETVAEKYTSVSVCNATARESLKEK